MAPQGARRFESSLFRLMASNTSTIGTIGVYAVMQRLLCAGYKVFLEVTNSDDVDLVTFKNGEFKRVQVKTSNTKKGRVGASRFASGRETKKVLNGDEFDVMAIYVQDRDVVLYVPISMIVLRKTSITIRIDPPKNGALKNTRSFEEFLSYEKACGHSTVGSAQPCQG